ncbi:hypothetical protein [Nonomuraea zeae]|uniref:DUF732 domain-containing protein n=1 Tax=Nonomuraea zeae TaxID=1642303 RepID=A0A5S4F2A1_9ACTN|nr:hypothetical protein [Nonomuraea zeae]TMR10113.1 hypothetical protein ETD85_60810 [Nonomuraea zeae]
MFGGTLALLLAFGIALVGGGDPRSPTAGSPAASDLPSILSNAAEPERILAGDRADFLATLSAIDPQLIVDQESTVHYGISTCLDILEGADDGEPGLVEKRVRLRFERGGSDVSPSQAMKIVKAVNVWCR